jgi:multidrug efflux pump subunit AcrA (membrane-fusion protein)
VRLWAAAQGGPAAAPLSGTVREVAASADPLTRTYQVKLALPADAGIPLGATAYVALAGSAAGTSAMALPTSAIMRSPDGGQGSSVWVFDPATSTVKPRTVQLSGADGNHMLVVSGLKPGEEVVAAGVHVLTAGQKVVRFGAAAPASN